MRYYPQIDLVKFQESKAYLRQVGFGATLCGPLGGGKGLFAMELLDMYSPLRPCFTNMTILPGAPFYKSIRPMQSAEVWDVEQYPRGSFLLIDEADLFFWSQDYRKLGKKALPFMKLVRKRHIGVVFVCQRLANLYNVFRDLSQRHYWVDNTLRSNPVVSMIGRLTHPSVSQAIALFSRREFSDPQYKDRSSFRVWPYRYFARKYFREPWFDTDQDVFDFDEAHANRRVHAGHFEDDGSDRLEKNRFGEMVPVGEGVLGVS